MAENSTFPELPVEASVSGFDPAVVRVTIFAPVPISISPAESDVTTNVALPPGSVIVVFAPTRISTPEFTVRFNNPLPPTGPRNVTAPPALIVNESAPPVPSPRMCDVVVNTKLPP